MKMSEPVHALLPELMTLWQQTLGWQPDANQQSQFQRLYEAILTGNQQLNLTRITHPEEFWEKHLWDSLRGVMALLQADRLQADKLQADKAAEPAGKTAIDIGSGAGFPGIPVAIALPDLRVTLLDATRKKMHFLDELLATLPIANAVTLTGRAEAIGQQHQHRQTYDLALIRAVATAPICAEYALPLLKLGGLAILYRGQWTEAEALSLETAVAILGGTVEAIAPFTTPLTQSIRHCVYIRKNAPTPSAFPRAIGVPAQTPLE